MLKKIGGILVCIPLLIMCLQIHRGAQAQDISQTTRPPLLVELNNYIEFATQARSEIAEQLSLIKKIPDKVKQTCSLGEEHFQALVKAANNSDRRAARQHFQKAMRSFVKVSEFIAASQSSASEIPNKKKKEAEKRLYRRMQKRVAKLKKVDAKRNLGTNFIQVESWNKKAQAAKSLDDTKRLRACLDELKAAIIEVEDYIFNQISLLKD